jgi:Bacterial Ig-like domain (group 3)
MRRRKLLVVVLPILVVVGAIGAWAYWTATGSGTASGSVGTLNAPTNVVAKAANNSTVSGPSPVTITWTAPSGGVAPTGYRVIRDDGFAQTGASCGVVTATSCTDSGVPDGTYTYTVRSLYNNSWTADSTASNSLTVQNQAATTTGLTSSDNPSVVGEQVTYTATVSSSGSGTPTGTVTFKDGASTISCGSGSSSFDGTSATCKVTYGSPTGGSPHSITAVYSGDAHFFGSTSNAVSQAVLKAATTTSVASSANPSVVGQQVTYTATVSVTSPGGATPAGTVDFKDGGTTVCSAKPLTGSAPFTATCQQTYGATSSGHSITAVYSGDSLTATSTSSALNQVVNQAATTTALASSANPSVVGQQVTYTATVTVNSPGAGTPSGSVTFKDGGSTISCEAGSGSFNGSTATCKQTYNAVSAGHSITAVYNGDASFATSTSSAATQVVNQAATTTSVASSANPSVVGQQVTYTATVSVTSPGAGTPTGTVTFKDGTTALTCESGSSAFNGSIATCKQTYGTTGSHSITAVYGGDINFATSTSTALNQSVNGPDTFTLNNPGTQTAGTAFNVTITAKLPGGSTTDTAYNGTKCLTFSGPGNSPNNTAPTYPAQGACAAGESSASFASGVAIVSVSLFKAQASTTLTATQGAITGNTSFAVNSAGVAMSVAGTFCGTSNYPKNSTQTLSVAVPNDAYGNAFTRTAAAAVGLSLTNTGNWGFGVATGTGTTTVNITTGPANNTFSVAESGSGKSTVISITSVPSGFTIGSSCAMTST